MGEIAGGQQVDALGLRFGSKIRQGEVLATSIGIARMNMEVGDKLLFAVHGASLAYGHLLSCVAHKIGESPLEDSPSAAAWSAPVLGVALAELNSHGAIPPPSSTEGGPLVVWRRLAGPGLRPGLPVPVPAIGGCGQGCRTQDNRDLRSSSHGEHLR